MNIAIIGYGKMGHHIESIAHQKHHEVVAIIDNAEDWTNKLNDIKLADVAIEFTQPHIAPENILKCFNLNIPIVCGTTGWADKQEEILNICKQKKQTLFTATNFSIGVNIFAELNKVLANLMKHYPDYQLHIEETHHTQKLDSPSGTAISLANDIMQNNPKKTKWINQSTDDDNTIGIISKREGAVTGNHSIFYKSDVDIIEISHKAYNRVGFAIGAIEAAAFIIGKTGHFTMKDLLNINHKK